MDVRLVSEDRELHKLCQEVLAEIDPSHCLITAATPETPDADADLWLWDYQPPMPLHERIAWSPSRNLFLVHRRDLAQFRERADALEGNILLKPVTASTLTAFLGMAVAALSDRATTNSLRVDRDEMLQCLIQTNLKLQEYDQDRETFLARAVHDFRAPLTALSGYCGLLLSDMGPSDERQKEVLRRMQHSAKRLSRMASAMFQLSVGRHVKLRPDLQPGDIRECLDQALHEITPFADEKRIVITTDLIAPDDVIFFEAGQIEQVLINILDNACKFTPKAGIIEVRGYSFFWERRTTRATVPVAADRRKRLTTAPNSYRIDIRDSGAGIPPEHLNQIFEEYTSYAGCRDRSGGGLGLAITKMIISQHDGCVWAENTESGPTFSCVLPVQHREHVGRTTQIQRTA